MRNPELDAPMPRYIFPGNFDYHGLVATKSDHPFRCAKCDRMQASGSTLVWVSDSAHFFKEDWESLVNGSYSNHRSGWCSSCIDKVRRRGRIDLDGPHHPYGFAPSVGYAIVALVMLAVLFVMAVA